MGNGHTYLALFAPIQRSRVEVVVFAFFDASDGLLALRHITSAGFRSIEVPMRRIAADALALDARRIVMAHNHPSGDPEPSREDMSATRRIATTFDALGIRLVDHFVLATGGVISFRDRGLL